MIMMVIIIKMSLELDSYYALNVTLPVSLTLSCKML